MNASYSSSSATATTATDTVVVLLLRHYEEGRSVKMKNKKPALSNFKFILFYFHFVAPSIFNIKA